MTLQLVSVVQALVPVVRLNEHLILKRFRQPLSTILCWDGLSVDFPTRKTEQSLEEPPDSLIFDLQLVTYIVQALVSVDRLNKYLNDEELQSDAVTYHPIPNGHVAPPGHVAASEAPVISIKNGTFKWNTDSAEERATLKDVNLEIPAGSLVAVVGSVGSGKSSLLSCILGEVPKQSGEVRKGARPIFSCPL